MNLPLAEACATTGRERQLIETRARGLVRRLSRLSQEGSRHAVCLRVTSPVINFAADFPEDAYSFSITPHPRRTPMKTLFLLLTTAALAGCGVETASTAATAAQLKKQEMEQAKKTMENAQKKIDGMTQQMQQRSESADK